MIPKQWNDSVGSKLATSLGPEADARAWRETPLRAELHPYVEESWFTEAGARIKLRRLQRAGLPNFKNWRFITLTVANRSIGPREGYDLGKDRLRRFLARFRSGVGHRFKWCWKLEFHEDGYAHWHLLLEYTKRIPPEMLGRIEQWWGLGRINVRRVKGRDVRYVFKYVSKAPDELPDWICRHRGRTRVFQACAGFYTNREQRLAEQKPQRYSMVRVDLLTRAKWATRKAALICTTVAGEKRVRMVKLRRTFGALLQDSAEQALRAREQLAAPGVINLSQREIQIIQNEHKRYAGLALVPSNAAAA